VKLRLLREINSAGRTKLFTGPAFLLLEVDAVRFINGVLERHSLGILDIDRFAPVQAFIEGIRHLPRTFLGTNATGNALIDVHIARMFPHRGEEAPHFPFQTFQFRHGDHLDIEVAPALDQFWGQDAHGTVIGRKGLVQLGHDAADSRRTLHQIDVEARIGQVEGSLDTGHATAHYHHRPQRPFVHLLHVG